MIMEIMNYLNIFTVNVARNREKKRTTPLLTLALCVFTHGLYLTYNIVNLNIDERGFQIYFVFIVIVTNFIEINLYSFIL